MNKNRAVRLSFFLSILLHTLLATGLYFGPALAPKNSAQKPKSTQVEWIDVQDLKDRLKNNKDKYQPQGQVVDQSKNRLNDEIPEDARFLSRHNQKVIRETQAAHRGQFINTPNTEAASTTRQPKEKAKTKRQDLASQELSRTNSNQASQLKDRASSDLKAFLPSFKLAPPEVAENNSSESEGRGAQASATDDHLKNVATGMQTLLSTREFVYYSYYNRIKSKLRQYWEPKIKEKMERIIRQGRAIANSTDRVTRMVIVLDHMGTLVAVQVIGPSGVQDLDDAAIEAFRAAAPFPNPPKGIIESDGTIKIRWDFILEA